MKTMTAIENKYIDVCEGLGWSVYDCEDGHTGLGKSSPAGEDFSFYVSNEGFVEGVEEYSNNFDADEHIVMWIGARRNGVSGIPSIRELVKDAEDIGEMIRELAMALTKVRKSD